MQKNCQAKCEHTCNNVILKSIIANANNAKKETQKGMKNWAPKEN